jgi:NADP-dependent 3-hydroxy acid dehydrogenase YdfG
MADLTGNIAWITGAGRGIGAAIAKELAMNGSRVVLSSRRQNDLQKIADEIHAQSGQALVQVCDVSKRVEVQRVAGEIKSTWGAVNILINNAGIAVFRKIIDTVEEDWDAMMQTNVKSAFLCCQAVLPDMIALQSGHIINIVSVAGRQPYYNCGGYCASKYALNGFTDVLRIETRKYGIKVTSILPGATDTAIWGDTNPDRSRMMSPDQVGKAVVAVCGAASSMMIEELLIRPQGGDL